MRHIEIDGKRHDVPCCNNCPCYDGGDNRYGECCKHPDGDGISANSGGIWYDDESDMRYGPKCPLRTKPELAEGGVIDPSKAGDVYLDPPGSNEEKEIVIPEWAHTDLSEKEALGYMLAFSIPMLLEDIAKMDPETKERTIKNLEEMLRMAQMKPEERPLCTMDQEEAIKRGIEACTVKGDAQDGTGSEHLQ